MLKRFRRAYNQKDYEIIKDQFTDLVKNSNTKLPLDPSKYLDDDKNFQAEGYWVDVYLNNQKTNIGKLARFFINILMIPHSNCLWKECILLSIL